MSFPDITNLNASIELKYDTFIELGWNKVADKEDGLTQCNYYWMNKVAIEIAYPNQWVVIINQEVFANSRLILAEIAADTAYPDRQSFIAYTGDPAYGSQLLFRY